jgi:lipoate-protein ligase A
MDWEIVEQAASSAEENMQWDAQLLKELGQKSKPILHLYEWERPSVTYGYFIRPETVLDLDEAKKRGLDLARRPTGGGVVFHLWDLAFSVLVPARSPLFSVETLDNYRLINGVVQEMVSKWLGKEVELARMEEARSDFCMAGPTKYDVVMGGKKVAGAAQRKTRDGFLHQGTISLTQPDEEVIGAIVKDEAVKAKMGQNTAYLCADLGEGRKRVKEFLKEMMTNL